MNILKKISVAFVALLFVVGITANSDMSFRGMLGDDADTLKTATEPVDSPKINENSVVDEVVWVVGDEPILKSDVEATRLQGEAEGIRFSGDPDCSIPEQIALQKLFLHQEIGRAHV